MWEKIIRGRPVEALAGNRSPLIWVRKKAHSLLSDAIEKKESWKTKINAFRFPLCAGFIEVTFIKENELVESHGLQEYVKDILVAVPHIIYYVIQKDNFNGIQIQKRKFLQQLILYKYSYIYWCKILQ